jgi:isoleucyl-tRNA synthetase
MPAAQLHYPFENKDKFEQRFPADFICEGIDQTRGWFYSLLAISTLLFDEPAYKNIVVNELILDKNGQKMSKTRGNAIVPQEIIEKYGADAIRWYLMTVSSPWIPKKFDPNGVAEVQRKFFNTLLNTYSFFVLYANVDQFDPNSAEVPFERRPEIDRWALSKLYTVVKQVEEHFDEFNLTRAARVVSSYLIDDVSNWYVRRNRRRFWKSEDSDDKLAAYQTLYEVLLTVVKLIAPYAPFISEEIFLNLNSDKSCESVHHCSYPQLSDEQKSRIDAELEERMEYAQKIVSTARSLRNEAQIKVRQPLSELVIRTDDDKQKAQIEAMTSLICEELNVKNVRFIEDITGIMELSAKPNFKTLGAKAGKLMGKLAASIKEFNLEQIQSFRKNGFENISIEGHEFKLEREDVIISAESKEGFIAYSDNNLTLGLNTVLTEELIAEGLAREFVNRIQNLRKEAGFEVTDRIIIQIEGANDVMAKAVETEKEYIANETLADKISMEKVSGGFVREVEIENISVKIALTKVR